MWISDTPPSKIRMPCRLPLLCAWVHARDISKEAAKRRQLSFPPTSSQREDDRQYIGVTRTITFDFKACPCSSFFSLWAAISKPLSLSNDSLCLANKDVIYLPGYPLQSRRDTKRHVQLGDVVLKSKLNSKRDIFMF